MLQERTKARKDLPPAAWRQKIHEVIFEADTPLGKLFDVVLLIAILISTVAVMAETVKEFEVKWGYELRVIEWIITIFFTIEFIARIVSVGKPMSYVLSFYGIIDLLSILPSYLGLFFINARALQIIRVFRLLRVFRIFKLGRYLHEAELLATALRASKWKITVFLGAVFAICILMGTLMYLIEGGAQPGKGEGFTSIPRSIYWAIVTLTTVGYGDISPGTPLGQALASFIMILGYSILAVPTGIVTVELGKQSKTGADYTRQACSHCSREGHAPDAKYCKYCGGLL